jgi:hypothetical protein
VTPRRARRPEPSPPVYVVTMHVTVSSTPPLVLAFLVRPTLAEVVARATPIHASRAPGAVPLPSRLGGSVDELGLARAWENLERRHAARELAPATSHPFEGTVLGLHLAELAP